MLQKGASGTLGSRPSHFLWLFRLFRPAAVSLFLFLCLLRKSPSHYKRHDSSPLLVKPPPGPRTRPPTLNKIQPSYRGCASPRPNPHLTGEGLAGAQMLTTFQQLTAFQPSAFQQLPKPRAPLGAGQEQDWPYSARGLKNNPLASRKCRKCLSPVS